MGARETSSSFEESILLLWLLWVGLLVSQERGPNHSSKIEGRQQNMHFRGLGGKKVTPMWNFESARALFPGNETCPTRDKKLVTMNLLRAMVGHAESVRGA